MNFDQRLVGDYKVYTVVTEGPAGGYVGTVHVHRIRGLGPFDQVYAAHAPASGRGFDTAGDAWRHAMEVGVQEVRLRSSVPVG
jgi:hypothetical protein